LENNRSNTLLNGKISHNPITIDLKQEEGYRLITDTSLRHTRINWRYFKNINILTYFDQLHQWQKYASPFFQ